MSVSTAQSRLLRDILWSLVVETGRNYCCKCKEVMDRNTFSIEHIKPWLDSEDPVGLFYDLENISFSHLTCNISNARRVVVYRKGQERDNRTKELNRLSKRRNYCPDKRREKYLLTGK